MLESFAVIESSRPSVRMVIAQGRDVDLHPILCGLEEEGIPVEVTELPSGDALGMAREAAHMSPLNVGIGVNGAQGKVALHHRDLAQGGPLFVLSLNAVSSRELRRLGINAARLVKGEPLVLPKETPVESPKSPPSSRSATVSTSASAELVNRIVKRVLAEMANA